MKRSFLLLCTVLLVLGCALPCAAYRLACMALVVQGTAPSAAEAASVTSEESSRVAPSPADTADTVCFTDQSTGQAVELPLREYLIGAVAAEMPVSWPDEALKAFKKYRREFRNMAISASYGRAVRDVKELLVQQALAA